jgi:hypothetical protein
LCQVDGAPFAFGRAIVEPVETLVRSAYSREYFCDHLLAFQWEGAAHIAVIPGRRAAANPEPRNTARWQHGTIAGARSGPSVFLGSGFRPCRPRNDSSGGEGGSNTLMIAKGSPRPGPRSHDHTRELGR